MKKWTVVLLGVTLLAGLTLACAARSGGTTPGGTTTPGQTATPGGTTPPAGTTPPTNAQQNEAVEMAKAALAKKLGIGVAKVSVAKVEAVQWPDTSLGVPEPGKFYAQVIVPGFRIILSADAVQYEYHSGKPSAETVVVPKP